MSKQTNNTISIYGNLVIWYAHSGLKNGCKYETVFQSNNYNYIFINNMIKK